MWIDSKEIIKMGDKVKLTKDIESYAGIMKAGTIVTVTGYDGLRGYDFKDDEGHKVSEAGFTGFEKVE